MTESEVPMTSGQIALARVDKHEAICEVRYTEIRDNIREVGAAATLAANNASTQALAQAAELRDAIRGTNRILVTGTLALVGVLVTVIGVLVFYMLTHPQAV